MIYNELMKRNLINDKKEFSEMIWLRQIRVNGEVMESPNKQYHDVKTIKIGILEFEL